MNIYKILTIINTAILLFITALYIKNNFPFYLSISKTIWKKIPHTITLMFITHRGRDGSFTASKGLFSITFRDIKKVEKIDEEYYLNEVINLNSF